MADVAWKAQVRRILAEYYGDPSAYFVEENSGGEGRVEVTQLAYSATSDYRNLMCRFGSDTTILPQVRRSGNNHETTVLVFTYTPSAIGKLTKWALDSLDYKPTSAVRSTSGASTTSSRRRRAPPTALAAAPVSAPAPAPVPAPVLPESVRIEMPVPKKRFFDGDFYKYVLFVILVVLWTVSWVHYAKQQSAAPPVSN